MAIIKKILSILFRVGISIVLLFFLFRQIDKKSLLEIIKNANKGYLFLAFIVFFFNYVFCLLRWQMLLKAIKIHIPISRIIISFAGGVFFSLFLPSTIGGDLMRSMDLAAHTKKPREVVATVFLDRLSGYIGLVVLALLSLFFGWKLLEDRVILISVLLITALLVIILLVLFNKTIFLKVNKYLSSLSSGKIMGSVMNLHQEIHLFRHHKNVIFKNLLLSVFVQIITPFCFYIIALSVGLQINIIYFFILLPIIGAITLLPISIGGLGLRDATTIFFFAQVGVSKNLAFAMSLLNFSFIVIYAAIGGLIYVLTVHHRRIQHHQPSPLQPAKQ
ncbi:MAG: lysylphosphatidylglycerol synthase transmembrane domain-containing protein [Candidatus Omnitrophica bacterium]|nr:lysylphosphatidylglycerol synthase transmembrane domain-containing protein [Candidatus Omnitrophota bacterium]